MTVSPQDAAAGHKPEPWFWEAGSDSCPHGPAPDPDTDGEAWDVWSDHHMDSPQDVRVCREAPAGDACAACSNDHGDMVSWSACRVRARRDSASEPVSASVHAPVTATVGGEDCWEQECDDFFDEDGDEIPGKETCSHLREMVICAACSEVYDGNGFPAVVAWADCAKQLVKTGPQQ